MERKLKEAIREILKERNPHMSYNFLMNLVDDAYEGLIKRLAKNAVAKLLK